jgi:ABC-type uncharacterized transport system permease subunit
MKPRLTVTIIELMALTMMVAICSNVWRTGQDIGWIATIVCVSLTTYWINHFRFPTGLPSWLFELPLIFLCCCALRCSWGFIIHHSWFRQGGSGRHLAHFKNVSGTHLLFRFGL